MVYFDPRLEPVLKRTLGVPLFQEQLLKIAMVMADFSGSEAEELRRALSFHRSQERMRKVEVKLRRAMAAKGVGNEVIERILQAISSFALYGFPESHAISFAILAYGSAYLKVHRAPEFYASLLNNQPMGFYSPATLVKDARRHGVKIRPICAALSEWRCSIEADNSIRLGFCMVNGLSKEHGETLLEERRKRAFSSLLDFRRRLSLDKDELRGLAEVGALNCFAGQRREALWRVEERTHEGDLPFVATVEETAALEPMTLVERVQADYHRMSLTTGPHPMGLLRSSLPDAWRASDLPRAKQGKRIQIAGNVICRQRPGTAKGFVFISLEDETGVANAIVTPLLFEKLRLMITQEPFLVIEGLVQNSENVVLIKAERIDPLPHERLAGSDSHDFH